MIGTISPTKKIPVTSHEIWQAPSLMVKRLPRYQYPTGTEPAPQYPWLCIEEQCLSRHRPNTPWVYHVHQSLTDLVGFYPPRVTSARSEGPTPTVQCNETRTKTLRSPIRDRQQVPPDCPGQKLPSHPQPQQTLGRRVAARSSTWRRRPRARRRRGRHAPRVVDARLVVVS